jgi:hypothetical protein
MARSRGRRTAPRQNATKVTPTSRRQEPQLTQSAIPRWAWPLLVLVTLVSLILLGTLNRTGGSPTSPVRGVGSADQTLVCGGGIVGAEAISAPGIGKPLTGQVVNQKPLVLNQTEEAEDLSLASQWAEQRRFLAFSPCPEPRADWWFIGVGGAQTHSSKLILDNPRTGVAIVNIRAFNTEGEVAGPGLSGISVPPGERRTLDLERVTPSASDLAVHLVVIRGLVTATIVDQWSSTVIGRKVSEWVPGQPRASRDLVITGLPAKPDRATLLVANPRDTEAIIKVKVIGDSGTFSPAGATSLTVPAESLASLNVKPAFDGNPIALRVSSDTPISATVRAVVNTDQTFGQVAAVLSHSVMALPPKVNGKVLLSSLGETEAVRVNFYDNSGLEVGADPKVEIAAGTTVGIDLPGGAVAVGLATSDGNSTPEGIVAGVSISRGKGIGGAAFPGGDRANGGPVVLAGW